MANNTWLHYTYKPICLYINIFLGLKLHLNLQNLNYQTFLLLT